MKAPKITPINFFDDLTSSYARKRLFIGIGVIIAISVSLIWLVEKGVPWPIPKEILMAVLLEVVAAAVITLSFYLLYVYFIGANAAVREVNVTRPQDIKERMHDMPKGVRNYMFWGRSSSFFRAHPLRELDKQAQKNSRETEVKVLLPDPDDFDLAKSYRDILKTLGEAPSDNPLLSNVLATCMACAIVSSNNKYLKIKIYLSRSLPMFRIDLSDKGAILTQVDKKKSALFFDYGSEFYDMFRSSMTAEHGISRKVEWDERLFEDLSLCAESFSEEAIKAFGIGGDNVATVKEEVARLIKGRSHRYE